MLSRGPGFLAVIMLLPQTFPLSSLQVVSLSQSSGLSRVALSDGREEEGRVYIGLSCKKNKEIGTR
jgi:hypothetical protein